MNGLSKFFRIILVLLLVFTNQLLSRYYDFEISVGPIDIKFVMANIIDDDNRKLETINLT